MKIKRIKNIGCFLVAVLDGGKLNCGRTYERVYNHFSDADGYWYSAGGKYAPMRKETDLENIKKLNAYRETKTGVDL